MSKLDPRRALFPGTFDPVTLGHVDVFARAHQRFDEVIIAVARHPSKKPLLDIGERVALLRASINGVHVEVVDGLVVDACRRFSCGTIVRGVRRGAEFDYEVGLALGNRHLEAQIDTVLFVPDPGLAFITSSLVREIASLRGSVRGLAPDPVVAALERRFDH